MSIYQIIGAEMKQQRKIIGETQEQIAEKLFISAKHYSRLEKGRAYISLDLLNSFAKLHQLNITHFLKGV